jgi:hypothetical protein
VRSAFVQTGVRYNIDVVPYHLIFDESTLREGPGSSYFGDATILWGSYRSDVGMRDLSQPRMRDNVVE